MIDEALAAAVGMALTGEPDAVAGSGNEVLAGLAEAGWTRERILLHARAARTAGAVWPHPVPDDVRRTVGSARLFAVLQQVQSALGVFGQPAAPVPPRTLTADERRLLNEVPPHHGH